MTIDNTAELVERATAALKTQSVNRALVADLRDGLCTLRLELEQLRAALQTIADGQHDSHSWDFARAALSTQSNEGGE